MVNTTEIKLIMEELASISESGEIQLPTISRRKLREWHARLNAVIRDAINEQREQANKEDGLLTPPTAVSVALEVLKLNNESLQLTGTAANVLFLYLTNAVQQAAKLPPEENS